MTAAPALSCSTLRHIFFPVTLLWEGVCHPPQDFIQGRCRLFGSDVLNHDQLLIVVYFIISVLFYFNLCKDSLLISCSLSLALHMKKDTLDLVMLLGLCTDISETLFEYHRAFKGSSIPPFCQQLSKAELHEIFHR